MPINSNDGIAYELYALSTHNTDAKEFPVVFIYGPHVNKWTLLDCRQCLAEIKATDFYRFSKWAAIGGLYEIKFEPGHQPCSSRRR